ncbi:hypothetical protein C8R45DRAFT_948565 [Mycena sanguinolenta]|nr:hypothetical protein C8R45DRAFT_948565 [Mycena sanguinolenta]
MIASEHRAEETVQASVTSPVALFINVGLKLQARQYVLRLLLWTDKDQLINGLGADTKKWHQQQQHICPQVIPFVFSEPDKSPEWEKLFLPSDFTSSEQTKLGLETLGAEELKLRQGEANNALRSLREHLQHSQALRQHKKAQNNAVFGQAKNTQGVQKIRDVQTRIQNYVKKRPKFGFPELRDEDLYTKNVNQPHNLGDGGKVEGWIWRQGFHGNLTAAEEAEYVLDYCFNSHHSMAARVQWH